MIDANERIQRIIEELNDAICMVAGGATFILVPHCSDKGIIMSRDGKPFPGIYERGSSTVTPEEILSFAMRARGPTKAETDMEKIRKTLDEIP